MQKLEIEPSTEPSDIIWENRYFSKLQRRNKSFLVFIIIIIMLAASASIIFKLSTMRNQLTMMYPPTTCKSIKAEYVSEGSQLTLTDWQKDALNEFNVN